jgi:hypothetical protein
MDNRLTSRPPEIFAIEIPSDFLPEFARDTYKNSLKKLVAAGPSFEIPV